MPRQDSIPQSQERPAAESRLRPHGHWDLPFGVRKIKTDMDVNRKTS